MADYRVRGGATIRKQVAAVQESLRSKHKCPVCEKIRVRRISFAVWHCPSCKTTFAGGAYQPETLAGKTGRRIVYGDV